MLSEWATTKNESRIVRVNSMQALFELSKRGKSLTQYFSMIITELETENIPSINARIKSIRKQLVSEEISRQTPE